MKQYCVLLIVISYMFSHHVMADVVTGVYGVPLVKKVDPSTYETQLSLAEIKAVFVPPDEESIRWFKERGFKVFVSVNVFGGKKGWKKYPDSRPIMANGKLLGSEPDYKGHGGVCPSHKVWRAERLEYIENLINQFEDMGGIDGIWLDYIRYPGRWGVEEPKIPDTCYCPDCLKRFQTDLNIQIPGDLRNIKEISLWIENNYPYEWMNWKKGQISSFVAEVKSILDSKAAKRKLILGLFLVPWTKGEKQDGISYRMAQDAFQLSGQVDVISPMLYHKMCGKDVSWVGAMTKYYKETARSQVWPIVQAKECGPEEFGNVLKSAGQARADGILVYSFNAMKPGLWRGFRKFQVSANLITNPNFDIAEGDDLPTGWQTGRSKVDKVKKSVFLVRQSNELVLKDGELTSGKESNCLGISAGNDGSGVWYSQLPDCEPGVEYVFSGQFYRAKKANRIYSSISIWGQDFYMNEHWQRKTFQTIKLHVTCPEEVHDQTFRFRNNNPGRTFWLTKPSLTRNYSFDVASKSDKKPQGFYKDLFPIGVYGANISNLELIKSLSINTVLIGGQGKELKEMIQECHRLGLKYVISVPRDPDELHVFLSNIAEYVRSEDVAFYVNDEPGIHSFPINNANDINRLIKDKFPSVTTCMAVVRPQACVDYLEASDFFMMDQYPVPYMPMTWLSDSIEHAAKDVGRDRVASVIQSFGGKKRARDGWPRLPTRQEIDCLAFLSIVHGSRGVFFYTFSEIGKTEKGRQRLGYVTRRLNKLYPWLRESNIEQELKVEMVSPHRVDPKGRPAIHCSLKKKSSKVLLLAVNSIGRYVEAIIQFGSTEVKSLDTSQIEELEEVFSGTWYPANNGSLRVKFKPFETKAFIGSYTP